MEIRLLLPGRVRDGINLINTVLVDDFAFQDRGSDILFLSFAGMAGIRKTLARAAYSARIGSRPFEFVNSLQEKNCDVLFLRDRYKAYYHAGVAGLGRNIDEVSNYLNDFIIQGKYALVVTVGHSMGGYASLLFASKINADLCIAISAPTFLDPENRSRYRDDRYAAEKTHLCESQNGASPYLDLQRYFLTLSKSDGEKACTYCLFYGQNDRLDAIHANRMVGLSPSFHVYGLIGADHNSARSLRNSGLLSRLVDNVIATRGSSGSLLDFIQRDPSILVNSGKPGQ